MQKYNIFTALPTSKKVKALKIVSPQYKTVKIIIFLLTLNKKIFVFTETCKKQDIYVPYFCPIKLLKSS